MKCTLAVIFLFTIFDSSVNSARILGVFQVPTRSHHVIGSSLFKGLAAKGHQVTVVSPFPFKENIPNYRDIYIDGVHEISDRFRQTFFQYHNISKFEVFLQFSDFTNSLVDAALNSQGMRDLLKSSNEKFDLIVIEPFGNEAFFGLGYHFNAPVIVLCTASSQFANHLTGNVAPTSFVPNLMTTYSDKMTFVERCLNVIIGIFYSIHGSWFVLPVQQQLYEKFFPNAPPFEEAIKTTALTLVNTNTLFETPRPYLPNMIQVAGLHIKEPKKLSQDIQKFLDEAKDGAIFFSLGSNLHSKLIPVQTSEAILKTFAKLPQKVLWKFEEENLPGKPDNVKIGKWFSQTDILAHPNLKLFITHGGLLSSIETLHRGVPILGIPFYGDQFPNTANFESSGFGRRLSFENLTEESFTEVLQDLLNNPKYRKNIQEASAIMKDEPIKPLDKAIFWVEYVLRHNGAKHLRSASLDLTLAQYLLLDVVGFSLVVLSTFAAGIILVVKVLCCSSKKNETDKKSKKLKPKRE